MNSKCDPFFFGAALIAINIFRLISKLCSLILIFVVVTALHWFRILDSLLSLGRDLCPVPAPMGPDPVLYSTLITVAGTGTGAAGFDDDEDADGVDGETAAQLRYREIATSGQCDIPVLADPATLQAKEQDQDQEEQISDVWNLFNRDVEWM